MGNVTGISWCDHTFNPWAGCTKVSPACDNCYAEKDTKRYGYVKWGKDADRRRTSMAYWRQLDQWNAAAKAEELRRRVFVGSWCDIMEDRPELQPIRLDMYVHIEDCPNLDFLLLTKRPQNFRKFLPQSWLRNPRSNVWGMTTVESEDYLWRAKELVETPFSVRGLSCEPMLGPISLRWPLWAPLKEYPYTNNEYDGLRMLDWVIVGGESQVGARPMPIEWARELRDQCVAAGVAFHFKQWGEHDANLVKIGKKAAGHLLDGIEWLQIPKSS